MHIYTSVGLLLLATLGCGLTAQAQDTDQNTTWADLRAEQVARLQALAGAYEGQIGGKYAIRLQLSPGEADTLLTGTYYYVSKGQPLEMKGFTRPSVPTQALELRENTSAAAEATGWFTISLGQANEPEVQGQWFNASGTTLLPVKLWRVGGAARPPGLVAHVTPKTHLQAFRVPVVTVPDAGVTRLLAYWFSLENLTNDDIASLRQQLAEHGGTQSADYSVNYNARGLLSLTTEIEGRGASVWYERKTYNLDLVTGFSIRLADELKPELLPQFLALGQRKLAVKARECVVGQDDFLSAEDQAGVLGQEFFLGSTEEYTIGANGLVFDHPVSYDGLSNFVWKVLQGSFPLTFTHAELKPFLKPDSPLRRLL
ncbi:hypothetical protein [Hymenobacter perfusus]|uniref:DUF3298 domain-containing protein n=1 Tax=Hymenobacter perfusus TaxID=1236770 RepID=A0A428KHQ8_9BACT|nr:hypothetical protein [Hymenobacter perfusus]RSK45986.1 hypothetical protein EI293_02080 [Hymenobacter perfusus]